LTKEKLNSREPFSVTTKPARVASGNVVVPEEISDAYCGASGTHSMLQGCSQSTSYLPKANTSLFAIEEDNGVELD